jgi:hypothetical protein
MWPRCHRSVIHTAHSTYREILLIRWQGRVEDIKLVQCWGARHKDVNLIHTLPRCSTASTGRCHGEADVNRLGQEHHTSRRDNGVRQGHDSVRQRGHTGLASRCLHNDAQVAGDVATGALLLKTGGRVPGKKNKAIKAIVHGGEFMLPVGVKPTKKQVEQVKKLKLKGKNKK